MITLDHLSGGRVVLGVGAGYPLLPDYTAFGDRSDAKVRAAKLDEGLQVLAALLSGEPVNHHGAYYHVECDAFQPTVQRPRVPIWVAASWPSKKPLERASRWDGVVPVGPAGLDLDTNDLRSMSAFIHEKRGNDETFDIVTFGKTEGPGDTAAVRECADAGATWWCEYIYTASSTLEATRARIRQGPPLI